MSVKVLGLDPGVTTGYAMVEVSDRTISLLTFGVTKDMTLVSLKLLIDECDHVCYEGWRTFKKKARTGAFDYDTMPASQVIGSLKTLLRLRSDPPVIHENLSNLKPVGYGYANMKYAPGKKGQHWQDAFAHAVHYCVSKLGAHPVTKKS